MRTEREEAKRRSEIVAIADWVAFQAGAYRDALMAKGFHLEESNRLALRLVEIYVLAINGVQP